MNDEERKMKGPDPSDDWFCPKCDLGFGSQECEGMTKDGEAVACPKCGGPLVDAGNVEMKPTAVPIDSEFGKLISDIVERKKKFDEEHGDLILADDFSFPLKVEKVIPQGLYIARPRPDVGNLVKVRPVEGEKTYLGILLGDLIVGVEMALGTRSNALFVTGMRNPAIYIPALRRVVWGRGSWWAEVEKEEDLSKLITDKLIGETWYVKALAKMLGLEVREEKKEEDLADLAFDGKTDVATEEEDDAEFIAKKRAELREKGLGGGEPSLTCPECGGSGMKFVSTIPQYCERCKGKGKI